MGKIGHGCKYTATSARTAAALCRRGLTDAEIAARLGIGRSTLRSWRRLYPEFDEAMKESKEAADALVEAALFELATGTWSGHRPELGACMAWLCNRRPAEWRHVNRVELSGPDGAPLQFEEQARDARERLAGKLAGIAAASAAAGIPPQPD